MIEILYFYLIAMFFLFSLFLYSLLRINEKQFLMFRKDVYILLENLDFMFDITDDKDNIEKLEIEKINNYLLTF